MDYVREHKFCLFIMSHGKPENDTHRTLVEHNYQGDIFFVVDDEDKKLPEYIQKYGEDKVCVFNKDEVAKKFDLMDNSSSNRSKACVIYARNVCFDFARRLGYEYFSEWDDDYVSILTRWKDGKSLRRKELTTPLEDVFNAYIDFLECSPAIQCVALPQVGDLIGGQGSNLVKKRYLRKCMNTQICKVSDRFYFNGRINEDVNAYTTDCDKKGRLFLTVFDDCGVLIDQRPTQTTGGMTDTYDAGTYLKSFYSVMGRPDAVQINMMGDTHYRIHHHINDNLCHPKIISDYWKKDL